MQADTPKSEANAETPVCSPSERMMASLWPTGAIVVCFMVAYAINGLNSESAEWNVYLALGAGTPILLTALLFLERTVHIPGFVTKLHRVLAFLAILSMAVLAILLSVYSVFFAAPMLGLVCAAPYLFARQKPRKWGSFALTFLVSTVSWLAAGKMLYWSSLTETLLASPYTVFMCLVGTALTAALYFTDWKMPWIKFPALPPVLGILGRWSGYALAILVLAWPCFRTDFFTDLNALHHWSHWIGPAESIREGSWLLWDVPSQYGFLSLLTIAAMPVDNMWEALYLFQSVIVWIVAIMVYLIFQRTRRGFANALFALGMALASVCFMSGSKDLMGPQFIVSVGPMRFVWCHTLLFLVWMFLLSPTPSLRTFRWLGSFIWLVGVLWSAESGVYSTAVFGAVSGVLALQAAIKIRSEGGSWRSAFGAFLPYLLTPLTLLVIAVAGITVYYRIYLGSGPDWYAYIDYVVTYAGGQCALPIESTGPVWVLVIAFCIVSSLATTQGRTNPFSPRLAALAGIWGATWAVSSYFVSRSHPNNVNNLMPVICMILGMLPERKTPATESTSSQNILINHAAIPILSVVFLATIGNPLLMSFIQQPQHPFTPVTTSLPLLAPNTREMLARNNVTIEQPLVYNHLSIMLPMGLARDKISRQSILPTKTFLPKPIILLDGLSRKRRAVFLERYITRHHENGWLMLPKELKGIDAWLSEAIQPYYDLRKVDEDPYDILYYCTLKQK